MNVPLYRDKVPFIWLIAFGYMENTAMARLNVGLVAEFVKMNGCRNKLCL